MLSRVPPRPELANRYSAVPPLCSAIAELSNDEEVEFVVAALEDAELPLEPAALLPLAPAEDEVDELGDAALPLELAEFAAFAEFEELAGGAVG